MSFIPDNGETEDLLGLGTGAGDRHSYANGNGGIIWPGKGEGASETAAAMHVKPGQVSQYGAETDTQTATDTGSEIEGSPSREANKKKGKNRSSAEDSPKSESTAAGGGQGKTALKWVRGTFCKFAKA